MMGEYVVLDAARMGSPSHRLRNYFTNLCDPTEAQRLVEKIRVPTMPLNIVLPEGAQMRQP